MRFVLALILTILSFSPAQAFWQGGGGSSIDPGATGQVLKTSGTSSLVWGESDTLSSWYFPSYYEMGVLYQHKDVFGNISGYYLTSSEVLQGYAWYKNMDDGGGGITVKGSGKSRPIRSFDVTYATGKYAIGDTLGDGKIFYVDATGKKGLIAALSDIVDVGWSNGANVETGATASATYAGRDNTIKIIDIQGTGSYAAINCRNYTPPSSGGGSGVSDATYITQVANGSLTAEQALGSLSTGILKSTTGTGIVSIAVADTDYVSPNTAITGGIKTKITYDAKGLVTAGVDATTADIADSADKRYCTDAQKSGLHTQGTDQGLDTGGANAVTAAQAKTAYTHSGLANNPHSVTAAQVGLGNVTNNAQYYSGGTDVAIADGGTGQSTQQAAINALTNVSVATNEYVLTKDTSSGNAIFKAAGSSGEANTASNLGATGAGLYKQKVGVDLQFKKLTPDAGNKIMLTENADDVQIGINQSNISHQSIGGAGTNDHATIDTFISSKASASGLASLDSSSKVVQNPANAVVTPTASKIPIADGSGKLDGWVTAVTPGGQNASVQFNDSGTFGSSTGLTYNKTTRKLTVGESSGAGYTGSLQNAGGGSWSKRRALTITAPAQNLPSGYTVKMVATNATAAAIYNACTAGNSNELRIEYMGTTELHRYVESFTASSIIVWFKLPAQVNTGTPNTTDYRVYYGNASAGAPPATIDSVFAKDYGETGLIRLYQMSEGAGTTIADTSGGGYTGTFQNTPTWLAQPRKWKQSTAAFSTGATVNFQKADLDYISASDTGMPSGNSDRTILVRVRTTSTGTDQAYFFYGTDGIYNRKQYICIRNGQLVIGQHGGEVSTSGLTLSDGKWHLVGYTQSGNNYQLFADGVIATTGYMTTDTLLNGTILLGIHGGLVAPSEGDLNEVRVYNRVLTINEMSAYWGSRMWVADDTVAIDGDFAAEQAEEDMGTIYGGLKVLGIAEYTNNDAAVAAGLAIGTHYRTGDTLKIVH